MPRVCLLKLTPSASLELRPGKVDSIHLAHAALERAAAGPVGLFLDDMLLCRLSPSSPQASLSLMLSRAGTLRCEGSKTAVVHIVGHSRGDPAGAGAAATVKRVKAADPSPDPSEPQPANKRAKADENAGPPGAPTSALTRVPRHAPQSAPRRKKPRVPRLRWGEEVLVAEYEPKRGGPSLGISPERMRVSLDEMEAAQVARALADDDDDDDDEEEEEEDDDDDSEAG
eukprot:42946-Prymnesium_polylepis.1